jgi:hypothetical protein
MLIDNNDTNNNDDGFMDQNSSSEANRGQLPSNFPPFVEHKVSLRSQEIKSLLSQTNPV